MNFLRRNTSVSNPTPSKTLDYDQWRDLCKDHIVDVGDMRPAKGKPKQCIIGERTKVSPSVATQIVTAVFEAYTNDGYVIAPGPGGISMYNKRERDAWAKRQLNDLAKVNRSATDADPFKQFKKTCGRMIYAGKPARGRGNEYISRDSATPMELHIWAEAIAKSGQTQNVLASKAAANAIAVIRHLDNGQTVRDGEVSYYVAVSNGEKTK